MEKSFSPVEAKQKLQATKYCQRAHKQSSDPGNESDFWGMKIHWVMMTM